MIEKVIHWLKQGLGSFERDDVEDSMQQLIDIRKNMHNLGALKSTDEVGMRSISWKQQIGAKRGAMPDILQGLIGSC